MSWLLVLLLLVFASLPATAQELFQFQEQTSHWTSPETRDAPRGQGGRENQGAKGHPYDTIRAGQSLVLADIKGAGIIRRIWITVENRTPAMLRSLRLEMFWDDGQKPAVSTPLGDFFGAALGQTVAFENALFSSPEGRSFNTIVPMPFRRAARIVLTNDSTTDLPRIFYDVDYTLGPPPSDMLYFHAYWRREHPTTLGTDFRVLPEIKGRGRYLGTVVGVRTDPMYADTWWGEGEMKVVLNSGASQETLVGTGTEDYIGTGWGQGAYTHRYQGSPIADGKGRRWTFYRWHVPDPIFFDTSCEVSWQQIGGAPKADVIKMLASGVALRPISIDPTDRATFVKLLERNPAPSLDTAGLPDGWVNFYRRDDVSATVYLYLDSPWSDALPLAPVADRVADLP
jgi:D-arabinan exo alpha-(1,3)/(1,5)-arabinofuranosidase (non-reducing end)